MWVLSDLREKFLSMISVSVLCGSCCFITRPRSTAVEAHWHTEAAGIGGPAGPSCLAPSSNLMLTSGSGRGIQVFLSQEYRRASA